MRSLLLATFALGLLAGQAHADVSATEEYGFGKRFLCYGEQTISYALQLKVDINNPNQVARMENFGITCKLFDEGDVRFYEEFAFRIRSPIRQRRVIFNEYRLIDDWDKFQLLRWHYEDVR